MVTHHDIVLVCWKAIIKLWNAHDDRNPLKACFTVARILLGIFSGFATGVCPMYIIELASKKDRGWIGVLNQLMITIGILGKFQLTFMSHRQAYPTKSVITIKIAKIC